MQKDAFSFGKSFRINLRNYITLNFLYSSVHSIVQYNKSRALFLLTMDLLNQTFNSLTLLLLETTVKLNYNFVYVDAINSKWCPFAVLYIKASLV